MIVDLPSTTTGAVNKKLIQLRDDVGSMALGRVLTLVVVVDEAGADEAIEIANSASRQHPCRIVCLVTATRRGGARLDAQIRVGGDAGASEVVIMRLYGQLAQQAPSVVTPLLLPDSPVVVWWPKEAPADVAKDPIGRMAQRRITDAAHAGHPLNALKKRGETYRDGDTDLAWTRISLWRGLLAAALDQPPYDQVVAATVTGAPESPSADLLAAWLAHSLKCPVRLARARRGSGIISVRLQRKSGVNLDLARPEGSIATLLQDGQPERRITLAHRSDAECLAEELRRLDPDEVYEDALLLGIPKLAKGRSLTQAEAVRRGDALAPAEAEEASRRIRRRSKVNSSSAMVEAPAPPERASTEAVKKAAARKLAAKAPRKAADDAPEVVQADARTKTAGTGTTRKAAARRASSAGSGRSGGRRG